MTKKAYIVANFVTNAMLCLLFFYEIYGLGCIVLGTQYADQSLDHLLFKFICEELYEFPMTIVSVVGISYGLKIVLASGWTSLLSKHSGVDLRRHKTWVIMAVMSIVVVAVGFVLNSMGGLDVLYSKLLATNAISPGAQTLILVLTYRTCIVFDGILFLAMFIPVCDRMATLLISVYVVLGFASLVVACFKHVFLVKLIYTIVVVLFFPG